MSWDTPVVHEPLPYDHKRGLPRDSGHPSACQRPEDDTTRLFYAAQMCPGCLAGFMAAALREPNGRVRGTRSGRFVNRVDRVRSILTDECDPMRVLFERALAERWGNL